jgi:hypothetical protein
MRTSALPGGALTIATALSNGAVRGVIFVERAAFGRILHFPLARFWVPAIYTLPFLRALATCHPRLRFRRIRRRPGSTGGVSPELTRTGKTKFFSGNAKLFLPRGVRFLVSAPLPPQVAHSIPRRICCPKCVVASGASSEEEGGRTGEAAKRKDGEGPADREVE